MDLSDYLGQDEVMHLNAAFESSLQHDSALVFWTGISPKLANNWACKNDLKTLTMAMGSLYADNSQGSLRSQKSSKSWSKYMKGASWVFAQHACQGRHAIVLTNAPPNVYSTRKNSNYRDIEEPILKGFGANRHATRIDYVHPTVPGAACFRYQVWPDNRFFEWLSFLEFTSVKAVVNKIARCMNFQQSRPINESEYTGILQNESEDSIFLTAFFAIGRNKTEKTVQENKAPNRLQAEKEHQATQEKRVAEKAAKRLMAEREQQAARERKVAKKVAKRLMAEREQQAARERKVAKKAAGRFMAEREQQAAQEEKAAKKAAKRLKAEKEEQAAREKKVAKKAAERVKAEREQQAAQEKKAAKRLKVDRAQQAAQDKKAAKRLKVEKEQQAAQERKAAKRLKVEREQQAAQEKKEAKRLQAIGAATEIQQKPQ